MMSSPWWWTTYFNWASAFSLKNTHSDRSDRTFLSSSRRYSTWKLHTIMTWWSTIPIVLHHTLVQTNLALQIQIFLLKVSFTSGCACTGLTFNFNIMVTSRRVKWRSIWKDFICKYVRKWRADSSKEAKHMSDSTQANLEAVGLRASSSFSCLQCASNSLNDR